MRAVAAEWHLGHRITLPALRRKSLLHYARTGQLSKMPYIYREMSNLPALIRAARICHRHCHIRISHGMTTDAEILSNLIKHILYDIARIYLR